MSQAESLTQKKLEQDIRKMFKLEAQRNDINYALSGHERGELTIQDYEDDLSVAISNYFVKDLLPAHDKALLNELKEAKEHLIFADGIRREAIPVTAVEQMIRGLK